MTQNLLISRVFPPQVGGSGRWMWELYSRFPCDEIIVAAGESNGSKEFDAQHDLTVLRLPLALQSWGALGWRHGRAYLSLYRKLCNIALRHHCTRVHAATCLPEGFLAWMLQRRLGIPYCVYVHGEELNVALTSRELTWMTRHVLSRAAAVIANSRTTRTLLEASWPVKSERLRILHPGVDTEWFHSAPHDESARRKLGWGDRRVILTVGRLQKRKGHDCLLRGLSKIRQVVPGVLYAIVGDGPERNRLEALIDELDLRKCVLLHGELQREELLQAYQQCDLFVLPNREVEGDVEGFGIVLLEAQSCEKAVIAGDSGGTAEAVNAPHSGLIVDCREPIPLVETIWSLLLDNSRRDRMGTAARRWVMEHFDWNVLRPTAQEIFNCVGKTSPTSVASSINC